MRILRQKETAVERAVGCLPYRSLPVLRLLLITTAVITACLSRQTLAKDPPSKEEFDAQMQLFLERLEERMEDWPREDLSQELPLDDRVHAQIRQVSDKIQAATQEDVRNSSWPNAEIPLRSISYVLSDSDRHVEVSYSSRSDMTVLNPEVVWQHMELHIRDGRLKYQPPSHRQVSPFSNVLTPIIRKQTESILKSATYAPPLSWPISSDAHEKLTEEMNHVVDLFVEALGDTLEGTEGVTGQVERIEYAFGFEEREAKIRVTFDVKGTADRYLHPGVEVDYKRGTFRLKDLIHPGWSGGVEYVGNACSTAMDNAIARWIGTFDAESLFEDARVAPPSEWQENAKDLPENRGRIVHLTRRSHPFLGEHDRKFRIELADGRAKTFSFPPDGGSVTRTDVYLLGKDKRQFIRFEDDDRTVITIALDSLKICVGKAFPKGQPTLTFPE